MLLLQVDQNQHQEILKFILLLGQELLQLLVVVILLMLQALPPLMQTDVAVPIAVKRVDAILAHQKRLFRVLEQPIPSKA